MPNFAAMMLPMPDATPHTCWLFRCLLDAAAADEMYCRETLLRFCDFRQSLMMPAFFRHFMLAAICRARLMIALLPPLLMPYATS